MNLTILYRGPLQSCNFNCWYCPFASKTPTPGQMQEDVQSLKRLENWLARPHQHRFSVFFTPWGEALTHQHYQRALVRLSQMESIHRVAIQTNLSAPLDWLKDANTAKLQFWCSFHPDQIAQSQFLPQTEKLKQHGVRFSVGVVGVKENFPAITAMRQALPDDVYLWINAYKHEKDDYAPDELQGLRAVDPLFDVNRVTYPSKGQACRCGETVFSLYGDGTMQRCHFIQQPIGNLYESTWEKALSTQPCTNKTCHCHIGYVHMPGLGLKAIFKEGILARIPHRFPFPENLRLPNNITSDNLRNPDGSGVL
jgi:organic radical activating enzyme